MGTAQVTFLGAAVPPVANAPLIPRRKQKARKAGRGRGLVFPSAGISADGTGGGAIPPADPMGRAPPDPSRTVVCHSQLTDLLAGPPVILNI